MKNHFEIFRTGKFRLDSACWDNGERDVFYRVQIRRPNLDANGFVIDNRQIENFIQDNFNGQRFPGMSCENVANIICSHLCKQIPDFHFVRVSITGNPEATWLTAESFGGAA